MRSPSRPAGKFSAREICVLALMAALIFATKFALASIPNINLNAPLTFAAFFVLSNYK